MFAARCCDATSKPRASWSKPVGLPDSSGCRWSLFASAPRSAPLIARCCCSRPFRSLSGCWEHRESGSRRPSITGSWFVRAASSGRAFSRRRFPATALWSRWGSPICRSFSPTRLASRPLWPIRETTASRSTSSDGSAPTLMARRIPSRSTSGLFWPKACCETSGSRIGLRGSSPSAAMQPPWSTIPTVRATTAAPVVAIPASRMLALPPPFSTTFRSVRHWPSGASRSLPTPGSWRPYTGPQPMRLNFLVRRVVLPRTATSFGTSLPGLPPLRRQRGMNGAGGWTTPPMSRCSSGPATGRRFDPNGGWRAMPPSSLPTAAER